MVKQTRFNHFQVVINLPSYDSISDSEIESYLIRFDFVKQKDLEDILLDLKIKSKSTMTVLSDFRGQLERGKKNLRPHWQLYLCTAKQTVSKELVIALSIAIFKVENHISIQVKPILDVESTIDYVTYNNFT